MRFDVVAALFGLLGVAHFVAPASAQDIRVERDRAYFDAAPVENGDTTMDIYYRAGAPGEAAGAPEPILVFAHGGGWRAGDKAPHAQKGEFFAGEGFVVASVNYRMLPDAPPAVQAQDVAHAVAWLRRNAESYDADPDRVFLMGHSAGAHLVALIALDPQYFRAARFPMEALRGVVLLDGAGYDLVASQEEGYEGRILGEIFGGDLESRRGLSPLHHISAERPPPPFLLLHVARQAAQISSPALGAALRAAGGKAHVVEYPGKTHRTINVELGTAGDAPTGLVLDFLRSPADVASSR